MTSQSEIARIAAAKPLVKHKPYATRRAEFQPKGEYLDLIRRRTEPFLDSYSISRRPIGVLLGEAYMQGLADAAEANERFQRKETPQ